MGATRNGETVIAAQLRTGASRDRRGRGRRGPFVLPGPLSPHGVPGHTTRRQQFDSVVLDVVTGLENRWGAELQGVEFGVEEAPWLAEDWPQVVPLSTLVRGGARTPTRIVVFRLPVLQRAHRASQLEQLVRDVLVERVAELLGRDPEEVDPAS